MWTESDPNFGKNAVVFDLFGSRDGEALAWLRSPYANEKKILVMHGQKVYAIPNGVRVR